VLTDLPEKTEEVLRIAMADEQQEAYFKLVSEYKQRAKDVSSHRKWNSIRNHIYT